MTPRILNVYCIFIESRIKGDELYVVEYPFHWDFGWPRPCLLLPPLSLYLNYFSVSIGLWVMLLVYICPPSTHIHSSIPFSFDIRDHPDQQPPQRCFVSHKQYLHGNLWKGRPTAQAFWLPEPLCVVGCLGFYSLIGLDCLSITYFGWIRAYQLRINESWMNPRLCWNQISKFTRSR